MRFGVKLRTPGTGGHAVKAIRLTPQGFFEMPILPSRVSIEFHLDKFELRLADPSLPVYATLWSGSKDYDTAPRLSEPFYKCRIDDKRLGPKWFVLDRDPGSAVVEVQRPILRVKCRSGLADWIAKTSWHTGSHIDRMPTEDNPAADLRQSIQASEET